MKKRKTDEVVRYEVSEKRKEYLFLDKEVVERLEHENKKIYRLRNTKNKYVVCDCERKNMQPLIEYIYGPRRKHKQYVQNNDYTSGNINKRTSKYKWIYFDIYNNCFRFQITKNKKTYRQSNFRSENEALHAFNKLMEQKGLKERLVLQ